MTTKDTTKEKKKFKMPHLLWIMIGMVLVCSLLTYIIPAGQFATDETGAVIGDQFSFLAEQTPVSPLAALLDIFPGLTGSASIIFIVMVCGASMQVFLDTKCFDILLDWAIKKMNGKGDNLIITVLFCLMVYLGGFGGSDALIAVIPVGLVFAKKMHLDQLTALGITLFGTMIGFGTGPTKTFVVQGLMGTTPYGAFLTRFIIMNVIMVIGLVMILLYVKKIRKDPTKSPMYMQGWDPNAAVEETEEEGADQMSIGVVINLILFIGQFVFITLYSIFGDSSMSFSVMATTMMVVALVQGFIAGMKAEDIANSFAKGLASMAFVGFVIGMAKTVSLVLGDGNVLHTIVYFVTRPLMGLPRWISSVGMTLIIAIINPIIPSATSKAAILVPILKPIGETLGMEPEVIVQAFQFGDGYTNLISPLLGWTAGGVALANVPFAKWVKWILPKILILLAISCGIMFFLTVTGWTGAF